MLKIVVTFCVLCISIFKSTFGLPYTTVMPIQEVNPQPNVDLPLDTTEVRNGKRYYFGIVYKGNFFQAVQFCNYHNMELLSIETAEENAYLFNRFVNFIGTERYGFWTSGTLLPEISSHWIWLSTGKPVTHPSWAIPPYDKNKSCLDLNYVKANKGLVWADANCNEERHVICQTKSVPT